MATAFAVKIKIESQIENIDEHGLTEGDPEITVENTDGYLMERDGEYTLTYTSKGEYGELESEIVAKNGTVRVIRRGAVESDFYFAKGEEHCSLYTVAPYKFDVTIKTDRVEYGLDCRGGNMRVLYKMNIGGQDKTVRMKIWIQAI